MARRLNTPTTFDSIYWQEQQRAMTRAMKRYARSQGMIYDPRLNKLYQFVGSKKLTKQLVKIVLFLLAITSVVWCVFLTMSNAEILMLTLFFLLLITSGVFHSKKRRW